MYIQDFLFLVYFKQKHKNNMLCLCLLKGFADIANNILPCRLWEHWYSVQPFLWKRSVGSMGDYWGRNSGAEED